MKERPVSRQGIVLDVNWSPLYSKYKQTYAIRSAYVRSTKYEVSGNPIETERYIILQTTLPSSLTVCEVRCVKSQGGKKILRMEAMLLTKMYNVLEIKCPSLLTLCSITDIVRGASVECVSFEALEKFHQWKPRYRLKYLALHLKCHSLQTDREEPDIVCRAGMESAK